MAGQNTSTGEKSQATQSFFIFVRDNNSGQIKSIVIPGDVQVGLDGNPADLTLMGRFSVAAKNYDVSLTNKGILQTSPDDTIIGVSLVVTPISGRISLYLSQSPREGELHFVKDLTGTSNVVPIDVFPTTGYTIDGMPSVTLSDPTASLALVFLNGNWHRLVAGLGTSGGSGASNTLSFVTINPEPSLTSERHLTGSTNILMTDHGAKATVSFDLSQILGVGAGTFTYATVTADAFGRITAVSAGATPPSANSSFLTAQNEPTLPNHRQMSGGLGTTVTDSGAGTFFEFNVDPRVVPFLTGAIYSGPVIFNSGLTGSLQQLPFGKGAYIVGIGGINVTTGSNGQIIISGSSGGGGTVTSITGSGGTSVSNVGGAYTISSSVYADQQAAYLLVVPEPTVDIPNARTLAAGSNITFTDGGPGGIFTIASTGGGSSGSSGGPIPTPFPAVAYMGHCTGSLNFGTHTAWTDLITTIPTNWFDDVQQGITRNGTTFTVNTTGYYHFHTFFNAIQGSQYIAYRLSGSNGTILQRTTWQNGGQPPSIMDGIIQLNSGSSFKLQFYDSGGSTWGVTDPIGTAPDQENMRTGDVEIFLINPLAVTVNQVLTASTAGWTTVVDLPFDNAGSQTFTGNATVTILGYTFTQLNGGGASLAQVVPGTGVQWTNSAANDIFGGTFSAPSLAIQFQTLFPGYSLPDHDVRVWWWINQDNVNTNFDGAVFGVLLGGTTTGYAPTTENITNKKGFYGGQLGYNPQLNVNSTNYQNSDFAGFETYNVQMMQFNRNGRLYAWYIGSGSIQNGVDVWPSVQQMQLLAAGDAQFTDEQLQQMPISGSGNPSIFFGEASTGGRAIVESYRRLRFDYLSPNGIVAISTGSINGYIARYTPPDGNTLHEWRCLDSGSLTLIDSVDAAPMTIDDSQTPSAPILTDLTSLFDGAIRNQVNANSAFTADAISEPPSSSFSLDCWVQWTHTVGSTNNAYIFGRQWKDPLDPGSFAAVALATAGPGSLGYWMTLAGGSENGAYSKFGFTAGDGWHHIGLTFDGLIVRLYLDGDEVFQESRVGNVDFTFAAPWFLSQFKTTPGTVRAFDGKICDARISNVVRNPFYFRDIYQLGIGWASGSTSFTSGSSGGGGTVTSITGSGGTTVTQAGTAYTVSSSIYADKFASYLLVSASAEDTNARVIAAGTGISFTDTGPGGVFTISALGSGSSGTNALLSAVTASLLTPVTIPQHPSDIALASITSSWTDVEFWFKASGIVGGSNTIWYYLLVDGNFYANMSLYGEVVNNGAGFGHSFTGKVQGLAPGSHTYAVNATVGGSSLPTITPGNTNTVNGQTIGFEGATLMLQNLTGSGGTASGSSGPDFDPWTIVSPTQIYTTSSVSSSGGFTGSLTQTGIAGNPYIVGIGSVFVTTNSLGQVIVSGSGGGGGTVTAGATAVGQAAYYGFVTASCWWAATGSWTPFVSAMPDGTVTDVISQSILRNGSAFQFINAGIYAFHANFNAYGSDAYISLRLNGISSSKGVALERSTYRTTPADQNQVQLDGVFTASIGDVWVLEYISSGTVFAWTGSNPLPGDGPMHTGEISIFMLPSGFVPSTFTETGSFIAPDANDLFVWPCHDTTGPYVLNYGTAGATGHMTASSAAVRFIQPGALRTSVGPNDNGATNNYIWIVNTATQPVPSGTSFSISAWFRPENTTTSAHQKIIHKSYFNTISSWNSPFESVDIALAGSGDGRLEFAWSIGGVGFSANPISSCSVSLNQWHHAGWTYDGAHVRTYLNGVLLDVVAATGPLDFSQNGWWAIGGNPALTSEYFQGQIEDVRVANVVRSGSWWQQVWLAGRPDAMPPFTLTGSGGSPRAPIFSIPILAGTVASNTSFSGSKQSLGMGFFNPLTIQNFGGVSRRYFFRAVLDEFTVETNMSAAIDLNDFSGIVGFPPTTIPGSIMSTSSPTAVQLEAELTSLFQFVTGSGLLEARLWRTVSGSLSSIANCRNARFDVEFS